MPIYYNTAPPTPTTKNTINDITVLYGLRDFLLLKNLVPTGQYLTALGNSPSVNIGEPILDTMVGVGSVVVPNGLPLETEGVLWKIQNVLGNTFKNISISANDLMSINLIPAVPYASWGDAMFPTSADVYPNMPIEDVKKYGIYGKTVNAKFKQDNLSKNLYSVAKEVKDASDYINTDFGSYGVPYLNGQIDGYLNEYGSLNLGGDNTAAMNLNIIGSITSGQGLGIAKAGGKTALVPNFDVRSSLAGRVLGAAGLIKDTKLGMIGGQQLALALANNAAFNLQQDILGALNIQDNILSLVKGQGFAGFPRPNYNITIPGGPLPVVNNKEVADYTSKLLGFTIPRSYVTDDGSIFQSESGEVGNVERANSLLLTTGKGQIQALIANVNASLIGTSSSGVDSPNYSASTFRSGYAPAYKNNKGKVRITDGEIYAFSDFKGSVINVFSRRDSTGKGDETIPVLNYDKSSVENDFPDFITEGRDSYEQTDGSGVNNVKFSWASKKGGIPNTDWFGDYQPFISQKKNILTKTQKLFNSNGMRTIVGRDGLMGETSSQIQTANGGGISKGSAVLSEIMYDTNGRYKPLEEDPEYVYCRSWTTRDRYEYVHKLIRNGTYNGSGLYSQDDGKVPFRRNTENSVLEDTGFVHIAPYNEDFNNPELNGQVPKNAKNYMLSIENLAWHDRKEMLPKGELGLGDPITGKQGRIMWFPPYDIQISESTSVDWESHKFIGRGENMYTYNNTERSGNLSFKIIVDHSTYTNTFRGENGPDDNYVASFMAGCIEPDSVWTDKFTVQQISKVVPRIENVPQKKKVPAPEVVPDNMNVYFPNDNATFADLDGVKFSEYENGKGAGGNDINYGEFYGAANIGGPVYQGAGYGVGPYKGKYTSTSYWSDDTNWGLNYNGAAYTNGKLTASKVGDESFKGFFSPDYYSALVTYLKEKCKHCNVKVIGYASDQGDNTPNSKLAKDRAAYVLDLLIKNVAKPLGLTQPQIDKRFKSDLKKSVELQTFNPLDIDYVYNGKDKTVKGKISLNGCKVCPRLEKGEAGGISKAERKVACPVDTMGCKMDRYASITFEYDADAALAEVAQPEDCIVTINDRVSEKITQKFYNETMFFDKMKKTDRFIFDKFRDKIKYFHPAFHSTTPEGFNSRLTFLQQCTRQGPTDNHTTNNLAFGRPPVCILRVGDFYHTKIIIDSINIDYEPLVWDLNPEGIGVQPMIANVSLSFKFIGAESLTGPINKLQNALSFNYYANTQVYDARADYISAFNEDGTIYQTINGMGLLLNNGKESTAQDPEIITSRKEESRKSSCDVDQVKSNEKPASVQTTPTSATTSGTTGEPKITGFGCVETFNVYGNALQRMVTIRLKQENIEKVLQGVTTRIITDDELKKLLEKGLKFVIEGTPNPSNASRYEEIVKWGTGFKDPWNLFSLGYALGTIPSNGSFAIDLIDSGNYTISMYYDNQKIQSISVTIGVSEGLSSNTSFQKCF
jgi:hypothetical protein